MSVTITGGGVTATVALRGAMTTAVFDLGDRLVARVDGLHARQLWRSQVGDLSEVRFDLLPPGVSSD